MYIQPFLQFLHLFLKDPNDLLSSLLTIRDLDTSSRAGSDRYHILEGRMFKCLNRLRFHQTRIVLI